MTQVNPPPPYLLGASVLFWGMMANRPVIGLVIALLVEGARFTRVRWDFSEDTVWRAWQLTCVLIIFAGALIYLEGRPLYALPRLLTWMPALLLPMQFIQSFGMKSALPLNTFSFLARRRRERNLRLGLPESITYFNFGNAYFIATIVAATLGPRAESSLFFLPVVVILTGWLILSASRSRPVTLLMALAVASCMALGGQLSLNYLDEVYGGSDSYRPKFNPNAVSTMVGRPGNVNLSPEILWRLRPQTKGAPPRLLRTATYNTYKTGRWSTQPALDIEFNDLVTRLSDNVGYFLAGVEQTEEQQIAAVSNNLPYFLLRGGASEETPLPLPGATSSLRDFELDGIERNSFGTIRIFPKHSVIQGRVLWQEFTSPENPPILKTVSGNGPSSYDLDIPRYEVAVLEEVIRELGLDAATLATLPPDRQPTLERKLEILRNWFLGNFKYSRRLTIESSTHVNQRPSAMEQFLTTERSGHCEYFASAATLLLRQAGIPARYAVGYSLAELDVKKREYTIRGTHGHAWTRVWDETAGIWIDFDSTPSVWMASVTPPPTLTRRFNDWFQLLREDFFLWRNQPANRLGASLVMLSIGCSLAGFVGWRLWKSRKRLEEKRKSGGYDGEFIQTPLNALEPYAEKQLGPRPPGKPLAEWLGGLRSALPDEAPLNEAIHIHQRLRFDPAPQQTSSSEKLETLAEQLKHSLKALKPS